MTIYEVWVGTYEARIAARLRTEERALEWVKTRYAGNDLQEVPLQKGEVRNGFHMFTINDGIPFVEDESMDEDEIRYGKAMAEHREDVTIRQAEVLD